LASFSGFLGFVVNNTDMVPILTLLTDDEYIISSAQVAISF